ncbi:MoxR family ATPase [Dyella solisilvae]|uniref:MoxR family ATPase n=1 Tax=Dyella solisilvae TaxID=1920168 RepID=A0A370K4K2_9GAMM|nr:MoxR family ATPase [Dyella solisilvae]RDI97586.1 MoxR family ATPase [Dyella solisilvae]
MNARVAITALQSHMEASIIGQRELIRHMIIGLLANGHLLLESLPGMAKTRAVKSMARGLDAQMRRIQFTPDLLPSDITGTEVLHQHDGQNVFQFQPGPIFGNVILADEINRAPAKVQAALLEAMEERQITVAGATHPMPDLFIVLATQNPIEQEGTYPLPEAQLDRFLMKVLIDYPDKESEIDVLKLVRGEEVSSGPGAAAATEQRIDPAQVFEARKQVHDIHVAPAIEQYVMALVDATRHPDRFDKTLAGWIQVGASPRGGIALDRTSRVNAWLEGRAHVTPDDVRAVVHGVLRHRLILSYDASAEGIRADQVIDRILELVALPA